MISGLVQERFKFFLGKGIVTAPVAGKQTGVQSTLKRKFIPLAIGFASIGVMTIATATVAQSAATPASVQHSTCAADAQGLMCNPDSQEFEGNVVQVHASQATAASGTQPLSNAQMEHIADILLGLLYFVLPSGFGIALFLHDRNQAQRTATLEAQIKLLEKLWEQTPQA